MFDIAACQCQNLLQICNCTKKENKVSQEERAFLVDQRNERKLFIDKIDIDITEKNKKRQVRQEKLEKYNECQRTVYFQNSETPTRAPRTKRVLESEATTNSKQMRTKLSTLARECDRYNISDRAAASLATAVLQDLNLVTEEKRENIIDKNKVRRHREKYRKFLLTESKIENLTSIYFDGRKDWTLNTEKKKNKYYSTKKQEEHVVILQEPEGLYVGHYTPLSGSANSLADGMLNYLEHEEIAIDNLTVIGCNGCPVNTGINGGVIRIIEEKINRPLQRFVCLLHANELPLRHLFFHLDGVTQGPRAFAGSIGKLLSRNVELLPVIEYDMIEFESTDQDFVISDLSTDQKLLLQMCQGISNGCITPELANRTPGPVCHSRWLTLAIRILRLYVSTENPSDNLKTLTTFIMRVYAPTWFSIKSRPSCVYGTMHFFKMVQSTKYLPQNLKNIVHPVLQRNAFFAHVENVILAMMCDDRNHIRELALRRVLSIRSSKTEDIRKFIIPKINFEAENYLDMIDWSTCQRSEPPILRYIEEEDLKVCIQGKNVPKLNFIKFPCHNQGVERAIKMVSEASLAVNGHERRDGYIRAKIKSRKIIKDYVSKKNYQFE